MEESILSKWKAKKKDVGPKKSIDHAPIGVAIPLSRGQQRLWLLQQLHPKSTFYNYSESHSLKGDWQIDKLKESIKDVYNSHDILRSRCLVTDNEVYLDVDTANALEIKEFDLSGYAEKNAEQESKRLITEEINLPFDLEKSPLIRVSLIKLKANHHLLNVSMHHIITDEWSMDNFNKYVSENYKILCEESSVTYEKPEFQFKDFAFWDRNREISISQLDYWKEKLSGELPSLNVTTDYKRPSQPSFKGGQCSLKFSKECSKELFQLAKEWKVTPFTLFLSIYYVSLYRYTNQTDILIGSPIANRDHKVLENILGFFVDTLVLRTNLDGKQSFKELVSLVNTSVLEAFSNKDTPFDILVKEMNPDRSLAENPFFQTMFVYQAGSSDVDFGPNLSFEKNDLIDWSISKFDTTLFLKEIDGVFIATMEYATDLFKSNTIELFLQHFELLAKNILSKYDSPISEIPMLTSKEETLFFPESKTYPSIYKEKGIHQIIEEVGSENREAIAVVSRGDEITYEQLMDRSNTIAAEIVAITKGESKIVGLCTERSIEMIIGVLGILKAGCAYLPIDPEYPSERVEYMLKDAEVSVVLTQKTVNTVFTGMEIKELYFDDISKNTAVQIELPVVNENNIAYVIYTSGSTGKPKGVCITHKNIIRSTESRLSFYDELPKSFLLLSSIAFDSSKAGIFWTLCTGGKLVIGEKHIEQDMYELGNILKNNGITHTLMLPSLYNLCLEHCDITDLRSLMTVIVAGEACSNTLVENHFNILPTVGLYNEYGPTEGTVWCIAHKVAEKDKYANVPIGRPVTHSNIYILDKNRMLAPYGSIGEIFIGGSGLAKGYLNNPKLTAASFIKNPFDTLTDGKLYKTGDLGRYNSDGNIEFFGRSDQQIKIRGHRIEIDEIQNVIAQLDDIQETVVLLQDINGVKLLIAYIKTSSAITIKNIQNTLRSKLLKYMVPSKIIIVDSFPQLPNGKIDRKALEVIGISKSTEDTAKTNDIPVTDIQRKLVAIWQEVLKVDSIGIHDNFFDIGGDSLLSIQFIAKARAKGMLLSPNQLFDFQTISRLSEFISANEKQKEEWSYVVTFKKEGHKKPLFCLHAGGGHIFYYKNLLGRIDPDRPLYGIQAGGVYGTYKMHRNIKEMATHYIKEIRAIQSYGPYNILVYCFSASVGHEISRQMHIMGLECNLIVADTMARPWTLNTPERLKMRIKGLVIRAIKNPIRTFRTLCYNVFRRVKSFLVKIFGRKNQKTLEELKDNLAKISMAYEWKPNKGKVSLILGKKPHKSFNDEIIDSWRKYTIGGIDKIVYTESEHSYMFEESNISLVAQQVEQCCV